jgi:hypothetical protein
MELSVSGVSVADSSANSPRTVTYTLAAPGGTWDTGDNGTYTVSLVGGQVKDAIGTSADAGTLGTFDVSVGAVTFAAGNNATFTDADGGTVKVSLRGPGTGQLLFDDAGNADASGIMLSGTTSASSVTIAASGAGTSLGGLTAAGDLRAFTAKNTDISGSFSVSGALAKILARNATGSITLSAAGATPASITVAQARDLGITSASPIRSIKASEWLDTDATPDVVTTPALTSLAVRGALQAGVIADTIGRISATGVLSGAEIRATGNITSVTAAGMSGGNFIFAGVRADVSTLPDALDDFANASASIRAITLRGKTAGFSDTRIAAPTVTRATLGTASIGVNAGPNPTGLAADRVTSVSGSTTVMGPYRVTRQDEPGSGIGLIDFTVRIL